MSKVDQFESVFRAAERDIAEFTPLQCSKALLVTDLASDEIDAYWQSLSRFTEHLGSLDCLKVGKADFSRVEETLKLLEAHQPELIFTYRNLHSEAWQFPHSLGEHLDVLCQKASCPILILPHPKAGYAAQHSLETPTRVIVLTDHLNHDISLLNMGASITAPGGTLALTHVEDAQVFERYMSAISKIPGIETDSARQLIGEQLLKSARDYATSCEKAIEASDLKIELTCEVDFGSRLEDIVHKIESQKANLLVMHNRDDDQLAMHGLAYPLVVEVRQIPILLF